MLRLGSTARTYWPATSSGDVDVPSDRAGTPSRTCLDALPIPESRALLVELSGSGPASGMPQSGYRWDLGRRDGKPHMADVYSEWA